MPASTQEIGIAMSTLNSEGNGFDKLAFSLDETTVLMLDDLRRQTLAPLATFARVIIKDVMDSPDQFPIAKFYEQTWRNLLHADRPKQVKQLLLPKDLNLYLRQTSGQILGRDNRSEMFRILVALYASHKGIVDFVETKSLKIRIHSQNRNVIMTPSHS
jgi:hypothetical protein